jgi:transposase
MTARPPFLRRGKLGWLLIRPPERVSDAESWPLRHLEQDGEAALVITLVQRFAALLLDAGSAAKRASGNLERWLADARSSGVRALETFAQGLTQDAEAVRPAFTSPWSNGQTEGQVTKLKLLKRSMYGRANFDLLRRRLLLAA